MGAKLCNWRQEMIKRKVTTPPFLGGVDILFKLASKVRVNLLWISSSKHKFLWYWNVSFKAIAEFVMLTLWLCFLSRALQVLFWQRWNVWSWSVLVVACSLCRKNNPSSFFWLSVALSLLLRLHYPSCVTPLPTFHSTRTNFHFLFILSLFFFLLSLSFFSVVFYRYKSR